MSGPAPDEDGGERPIFATVGRPRRSAGERRAAGVLLLAAMGVAGASLAFVWDHVNRRFIHTVEVTWMPAEAAAADAAVHAELEAASGPGDAATSADR